jgi:hypothetical protein
MILREAGVERMIDLETMSQTLSQSSQHPLREWHEILTKAIHDPVMSQMTDGEIEDLTKAVNSPAQLKWILDLFRERYKQSSQEMPFDFMIRHVKRSSYGLREWFEAMQMVNDHSNKNQALPLEKLVDFVVNCVSTQSATAGSLVESIKAKLLLKK